MSLRKISPLCSTLLWLSMQANATTVHRCENAGGHVTFTTLGCSPQETLLIQNAVNVAPGGIKTIAPKSGPQETFSTKSAIEPLVIVGQHNDDCGNVLSAKERRQAIINQRIVPGMNQREVESALGKPDKVSIRNATTSYRYDAKKGRSAQIVFDEKGCVTGKR
ncbi:MAG: cell envelope protein SmpA [Pseudomonas sp.]|nr:cell envelope protein SmpA [Pseudomonas sp.]